MFRFLSAILIFVTLCSGKSPSRTKASGDGAMRQFFSSFTLKARKSFDTVAASNTVMLDLHAASVLQEKLQNGELRVPANMLPVLSSSNGFLSEYFSQFVVDTKNTRRFFPSFMRTKSFNNYAPWWQQNLLYVKVCIPL